MAHNRSATLAAELAALRAEHAALKTRHDALAEELAAVRNSRTWRLSAPLREFEEIYPRLMHWLRLPPRLVRWALAGELPARLKLWLRRELETRKPALARLVPQLGRFRLRAIFAEPPKPLAPPSGRRLLCISSFLPYPSRAGNEYRLARLLRWLAKQNCDVLLVVSPLSDEIITEDAIRETALRVPNLIVCRRDGTLLHHISSPGLSLQPLTRQRPRDFAAALGESGGALSAGTTARLRHFCPDAMTALLGYLRDTFMPDVLLAEYIFMTRAFPLFGNNVRKVIDTIDVFSNKQKKVEAFGIRDPLTLSEADEQHLLRRADVLIAIQPEEATDLRRLAPDVSVVTAGIDFDVVAPAAATSMTPSILLIASDNPLNVKGLRDFLRFAWPLIAREIPAAELRVAGSVGEHADVRGPGITILGHIDDVGTAYAQARVVINPTIAGTGMKIKTAEALSHGRPIVLWPAGLEGIAEETRGLCHIAGDWFDFAQQVIQVLRAPASDSDGQPQSARGHFAADSVYAPLAKALSLH